MLKKVAKAIVILVSVVTITTVAVQTIQNRVQVNFGFKIGACQYIDPCPQ